MIWKPSFVCEDGDSLSKQAALSIILSFELNSLV